MLKYTRAWYTDMTCRYKSPLVRHTLEIRGYEVNSIIVWLWLWCRFVWYYLPYSVLVMAMTTWSWDGHQTSFHRLPWILTLGQKLYHFYSSRCPIAYNSQVMLMLNATPKFQYCDVIMRAMAFQITSLTTVYSTVYSGADKRLKIHVTGLCGNR